MHNLPEGTCFWNNVRASKSQSVGFALKDFCRSVQQRCKTPNTSKTKSLSCLCVTKMNGLHTQQVHPLLWRAALRKTLSVNPRSMRKVKAGCKQLSNASEVWVLWWTHVNNIRPTQPITSSVRWRTEVFKIQGFDVCKRFLPSSPHPPLSFLALAPFFARAKHWKSHSTVFLCSQTPRKCLLHRLYGT